jgi:hypothetical protein
MREKPYEGLIFCPGDPVLFDLLGPAHLLTTVAPMNGTLLVQQPVQHVVNCGFKDDLLSQYSFDLHYLPNPHYLQVSPRLMSAERIYLANVNGVPGTESSFGRGDH